MSQFDTKSILARLKARREAAAAATNIPAPPSIAIPSPVLPIVQNLIDASIIAPKEASDSPIYDKYGNPIVLNAQQKEFVTLASQGQSCVMIGAAGTGKTTTTNATVQSLIQLGMLPPIPANHAHKNLTTGAPGIVICAFTRRATNNIRNNQSKEVQACCMTIHKLLCFEPESIEIRDDSTGLSRFSKQFTPKYNSDNPLPSCIKTIIIEEGSMVGMPLWDMLMDAIQHEVQFIFLGDLNQLPPVFGPAILGFKLNSLPVVELTHVYRQALDSPIIGLAHKILEGKAIPMDDLLTYAKEKPGLRIIPWKKKIAPENATKILADLILNCINANQYNPETDGILIPFNKSCGTIELNNYIANALAKKERKVVFEIVHKWQKSYYSIGDKCLYEKEDAIILDITENPLYAGRIPYRSASETLDYWGNDSADSSSHDPEDVDNLLASMGVGSSSDDDEGKLASSHVIKLHLLDSDRVVDLTSAGQIAALILGYAITVHKSQGSEWEKVFLFLHASHATMIARELLYTAVTRAKKELIIVCEQNTFMSGVERARIQGTTLAEKAEYFKGKQDQMNQDARSDNM